MLLKQFLEVHSPNRMLGHLLSAWPFGGAVQIFLSDDAANVY